MGFGVSQGSLPDLRPAAQQSLTGYLFMARSIPGSTGTIRASISKNDLLARAICCSARRFAVFFTAESERDLAKTSFHPNKWKSVVVPFGITDPEALRMDPSIQIEAFYSRFPELRGVVTLLFLARIHPKKGCDMLIEAFAKIAASVPDVDLVIAGPDQEGMQAKLQLAAKQFGIGSRVHWPGMIDGDLKWGALRACDAFVLSSHSENFGIAVVESLAIGRPVLISNRVNIWSEIANDGVGLVEKDTLEGTERLLRRWFALQPAERDAMAARTRPSFEQRFTMSQTALAMEQLFADIASGTAKNNGAGRVSNVLEDSLSKPKNQVDEVHEPSKV